MCDAIQTGSHYSIVSLSVSTVNALHTALTHPRLHPIHPGVHSYTCRSLSIYYTCFYTRLFIVTLRWHNCTCRSIHQALSRPNGRPCSHTLGLQIIVLSYSLLSSQQQHVHTYSVTLALYSSTHTARATCAQHRRHDVPHTLTRSSPTQAAIARCTHCTLIYTTSHRPLSTDTTW